MPEAMVIHRGSCHCGAVRFEVDAPSRIRATECDCSMCRRVGFLHLIVPPSRFRLLVGEDVLSTYTFNTATAKHTFCSICGVKAFYIPRSHPDGWSVNVRCLDEDTIEAVEIEAFDGRHWEESAHLLEPLSED